MTGSGIAAIQIKAGKPAIQMTQRAGKPAMIKITYKKWGSPLYKYYEKRGSPQ